MTECRATSRLETPATFFLLFVFSFACRCCVLSCPSDLALFLEVLQFHRLSYWIDDRSNPILASDVTSTNLRPPSRHCVRNATRREGELGEEDRYTGETPSQVKFHSVYHTIPYRTTPYHTLPLYEHSFFMTGVQCSAVEGRAS